MVNTWWDIIRCSTSCGSLWRCERFKVVSPSLSLFRL